MIQRETHELSLTPVRSAMPFGNEQAGGRHLAADESHAGNT